MDKLPVFSRSEKIARTSILTILLLAFLIRVPTLGRSSFWLDEIYSYWQASRTEWGNLGTLFEQSAHPPLYHNILLPLWLNLGKSEFFIRFLSMWSGLLSIAGMYALGSALFNRSIGLLSALLITLSPLHIAYSQEARMYSMAFLFTTFGIYFFFKAAISHSTKTKGYWTAYILCAAMSLYSHYMAGLFLVALFLFSFFSALLQRNFRSLTPLLLSHFLVAVLFAPWLPMLYAQTQIPRLGWVPETSSQRVFDQFTRLFLYRTFLEPFSTLLSVLVVIVLAVGSIVWLLKIREKNSSDALQSHLFTIASALGPVGTLIIISLLKPMFVDRYILVISPAIYVLLSFGFIHLLKRYLTALIPLAFAAGLIISAYGIVTTDLKEDWRGVERYISTHSIPTDVIVITRYIYPTVTTYYDAHLTYYGVPLRTGEEDTQQMFDDLQSFERAWIVIPSTHRVNRALIEYLENGYNDRLVSCKKIGNYGPIDVCLYARNEQ